jgi:hypothetical protein
MTRAPLGFGLRWRLCKRRMPKLKASGVPKPFLVEKSRCAANRRRDPLQRYNVHVAALQRA